jgi:hypothetical protein
VLLTQIEINLLSKLILRIVKVNASTARIEILADPTHTLVESATLTTMPK